MRTSLTLLAVACFTWSGCLTDGSGFQQAGSDAGADQLRAGDTRAADAVPVGGDALADALADALTPAGAEAGLEAQRGEDAGIVFPAVCAFTGTPCTPGGSTLNCLPRQDPKPALWGADSTSGEARLINCALQPLTIGALFDIMVTPSTYKVTLSTPTTGKACEKGAIVKPAESCYVRASYELPACPQGGCSFVVPAAEVQFNTDSLNSIDSVRFAPAS